MKWLVLAAGGILGTFSRYFLSVTVEKKTGFLFPWGTLSVNTLGCLAAGVFFGFLMRDRPMTDPQMKLFLITGFCGSFTTFSALILESSVLFDDNRWGFALANILLSVILGFAAFGLGRKLPELI